MGLHLDSTVFSHLTSLPAAVVSRGYFDDAAATKKAFVTRPTCYGQGSVSRIYRTGDLRRLNQNGSITILSRIDNQAKLHGQRLKLGEVEACIKECIKDNILGDSPDSYKQ